MSSLRRPDWVSVAAPAPPAGRRIHEHFEVYQTPTTQALLILRDSWQGIGEAQIQQRLADGDSWWSAEVYDPVARRWYHVVDNHTLEDLAAFRTRQDALDVASVIEADIADSRLASEPEPAWASADLPSYLRWFRSRIPNRVDYVRLLWSNDSNGNYDGLLLQPVRVAEEAFEEAFEDELAAAPNPDLMTPGQFKKLTTKLDRGELPTGLKKIGQGKGRAAYLVHVQGFEPTVLKIASHTRALSRQQYDAQSPEMTVEVACMMSAPSPLLPELYAWGPKRAPRWMEVELLHPVSAAEFEAATGIPFRVFDEFTFEFEPEEQDDGSFAIDQAEQQSVLRRVLRLSTDPVATKAFFAELFALVEGCGLNPAELGLLSNWGQTADGRLKISDFGDTEPGGIEKAKAVLLAY